MKKLLWERRMTGKQLYMFKSIYLVLEYCETDLVKILKGMEKFNASFELGYIKHLLFELLSGINYLHKNYIIHRDLKLSNLLLTKDGTLKIGDFGLARYFSSSPSKYTPKLVTLWYRAPEILLQVKEYSWQCDIWAIGCIFAEILNGGRPLLPGSNEVQQFELICELIGKPNLSNWESFFNLKNSMKLIERVWDKKYSTNKIEDYYRQYGSNCVDLLKRMLCWNPSNRISASEAMLHDFFNEYPFVSKSSANLYQYI